MMTTGQVAVLLLIVAGVFFAIGILAGTAQKIENLTRDEEQRAIQIIMNEYSNDHAKIQALVNELQKFSTDITSGIHQLSSELRSIVDRVVVIK